MPSRFWPVQIEKEAAIYRWEDYTIGRFGKITNSFGRVLNLRCLFVGSMDPHVWSAK